MTETTETDRLITADEFMELEVPELAELIRGRVVLLPGAGAEHGAIESRLIRRIANCVEDQGLGVLATGDTAFRIERDPDTVRMPDVGFVATENVPPTGIPRTYWDRAPDLAIEIVSPSDRWVEVEAKTRVWLAAGAREVWLVVPRLREVRVCEPDATPRILRDGDAITSDLLAGAAIAVTDVFGPAPAG